MRTDDRGTHACKNIRRGVATGCTHTNNTLARYRRTIRTKHIGRTIRQHIAADIITFIHAVGVRIGRRYIINDINRDSARAGVAVGIRHRVVEGVCGRLDVGAVVSGWRARHRRGQGVEIGSVRVDLDGAVSPGRAADQGIGQRCKPACSRQGIPVGLSSTARQAAGDGSDCEVVPIRQGILVKSFLVDSD